MASESTSTITQPQGETEGLSDSGSLLPVSQGKKVVLNIIAEEKRSHQQFGLRHDDYQRYRKYCSRRLHRIRKALKFTHQTGHKGISAFQKRPVEPHMVNDERYFLLVLFRCERAWAYAMQLKQDMEIQTNNSRLIHHHLRRLDKAGKYAQALERIAVRGDEHTLLQATAYSGYMQGIVAQERELWEEALTHLSKASAIYSKLGVVSGAETNKLCKEKEDAIDQRIRYCIKYLRKSEGKGEIKNEETKSLIDQYLKGHADLISKLDSVASGDKLSASLDSSTQGEVSWKGQRVAIQNEKLRTVLLGNAQKISQDLENSANSTPETRYPLFDQLFGAYADAMKIIKEEITALQKAGKGKAKDPQEQVLHSLQEYVTYLQMLASVQRSMMLADTASTTAVTDVAPVPTASKKKHPDEMARLYEGVIHKMEELEALSQGTPQDSEEQKVSNGRLVLCKASRCYWLAMSHASLQNAESQSLQSAEKAMALFDRSSQHAELASSSFTSTPRTTSQDRERLARLMNDITAARAKAKARAFLATLTAEASSKQASTPKATSLVSGMNTFDSSFLAEKNLTDFPPNLEAIPCKPLLFDLALNDCSFPDLEARKKPQQGKGFFGFWRS